MNLNFKFADAYVPAVDGGRAGVVSSGVVTRGMYPRPAFSLCRQSGATSTTATLSTVNLTN